MAQSKQFQEILLLGKTLVDSFSEHGRTDLTTSWMAHYLAELMQQVSKEKNVIKKRVLQKEASEIIMELWKKRRHFPGNTAPLADLEHAVDIIKALKDQKSDDLYWRRFRGEENNSVWGRYIYSLRNAVEDSIKITLSATVAKSVLDRQKNWSKHNTLLSEHEKEIIDFLDVELDKDDSLIKIIYTTENDPGKSKKKATDKMTRVFNKLRELLNNQTDALNKLEEQIVKRKKSTKGILRKNQKSASKKSPSSRKTQGS